MTIQEIIKKLENKEEVNFNIAENLICGSTNLLCRFNNFKDWMENPRKPTTVVLRHPKDSSLFFHNNTNIHKRTNIELIEENINLVIKPNNCYLGKIEGRVDELKFQITSENIKNYFYRLAGGKICNRMSDSNEIKKPISWTRNYKYEQDEIGAEFKYSVENRCLNVTLSKSISVYSSLDDDINDEVLLVCYILSFCTGSCVTILTKAALSSTGEKVCFEYISRGVEDDYKKHELMIPMREDAKLWIDLINHILQRPEKDKNWFTDQGIWQAIANLCWDDDGYDNWTFIKHAAALEGLLGKREDKVIDDKNKCRKIKKAVIKSVKSKCLEIKVTKEDTDKIVNNIKNDNNNRVNGYPVKWYILKTLKSCKLEKFSEDFLEKINDALKARNTLVHNGYVETRETELINHIELLRNTIFLIVLARLEYPGEFYFSGHEHEKPTSLQEWRS